MKKLPTLYVVTKESGDGYHVFSRELIAWFFNEKEAEDWADILRGTQGSSTRFSVEEVPGGKW